MSKFDPIIKAIGQRLRELFAGKRAPLTWDIIDKLESLAEAEETRSEQRLKHEKNPTDDRPKPARWR